MRMRIVWLAETLGYRTVTSHEEKAAKAQAASRIVYYDCGYRKAPKGSRVKSWMEQLDKACYNDGVDFGNLLKNKTVGSKQGTYTDQIERGNPGYLNDMFHKAGQKLSFNANWKELTDEMNKQSEEEAIDGRPILKMSRHHIRIWFKANGDGNARNKWQHLSDSYA